MNIAELQPKTGNVEVIGEVTSKEEPREFVKFGKPGRVCNAKIKDSSGEVVLTLWNEQIDSIKIGDKIKVSNGWASEWNGEIQLSTGKFGKLEVVGAPESDDGSETESESEAENEEESETDNEEENTKETKFVTNDPSLLKQGQDQSEFIDDDLE